jgi:hypothetical protein
MQLILRIPLLRNLQLIIAITINSTGHKQIATPSIFFGFVAIVQPS